MRYHSYLLILAAGFWGTVCSQRLAAQPIEVRPNENVSFQLCFYYDNVPGNPPATNQNEVLQLSVFAYSGYHQHDDSSRPKGSLVTTSFVTDGAGCSPTLNYTAPAVAGMHPILITGGGTSNTQEIWVGAWVNNGTCCVQLYENNDLFYKPNGAQPEHPSWYGLNVSVPTISKMQTIGQQYHQQTGDKLCVNDMSLNWGGVFDLGPRYDGTFWHSPHSEHTFGLNVDLPFSCNQTIYQRTMFSIATANGGAAGGSIVVHTDHYHLRFAD